MIKSITLIEVIFSIVLLGIIFLFTSNLLLTLNQKNTEEQLLLTQKIDFESTRLFLNHKIKTDTTLEQLKFKENSLYYDNNLLLQNVDSYTKNSDLNIIYLNLCIKNHITSCQEILIK
jgi:type II secretory pathway pseudopilin PulG